MSEILQSNQYLGEIENVYKSFGNKAAVERLTFAVNPGELVALLGPNGAGKTTTISMMLGLQRPDAGSVSLFGRSPQDYEARRGVGVMLQEATLTGELRVRELLEVVAAYYPDPYTPEEVMELTHTAALAERPYGKLSGGQKRLVQFAIAICGRPRILFLDEPTTGLDIDARETLWKTIRGFVARGTAVILTTHYLEEAEALADRIVVLVGGREMASGTLDQMRSIVDRKTISCRTDVRVEEIMSWGDVVECRVDPDGKLRLLVKDADAITRRLLLADPRVRDVEVRQAGLNEVFRKLTKETAQ